MTANPKTPSPATNLVLSAGDPQAGRWSFDTGSGKWTVEYRGKKSSSINQESLQSKIKGWKAASNGGEEIRLELLCLESSENPTGPLVPVQVVVAEPGRGEHGLQMAKFRRVEEGQGWRTSPFDRPVLIDPAHIDPALSSALVELQARREVERDARKILAGMARAWLERQREATDIVEVGDDEPPSITLGKRAPERRSHGSKAYAVPAGTRLEAAVVGLDTAGWTQEADGTLRMGAVRVELAVRRHRNEFTVSAMLPGMEEHGQIFAHDNLGLVLAVGRATAGIIASQATPIQAREGGICATGGDGWPTRVETLGGLVFSLPGQWRSVREPCLMLLQRDRDENGPARKLEAPGWSWRRQQSIWRDHQIQWLRSDPAGERALEVLARAKAHFQRQQGSGQANALRALEGEVSTMLSDHSRQALARAAERRLDEGEQGPDTAGAMAHWARLQARWKTLAEEHEEAARMRQEMESFQAEFQAALDAPAARGPRAR